MNKNLQNILLFFICINISGAPYETAQKFQSGDTISADVLNDILERIELTLKPISISELVGVWTAKQYICRDGQYGQDNYCDNLLNSYPIGSLTTENIVFKVRSDSVTITDNGDNTINWTSPNLQFFYNSNWANQMQPSEGGLNHTCSISDAQILGCLLHSGINTRDDGSGNRIVSFMNIKRTSPTRIVMFWGPRNGGYNMNHIILDKQEQPPKAPWFLAASRSEGTVTLSWNSGDSDESSYDIKRKNIVDDDYLSIGSATEESYVDSTLEKGSTYWYRVFANNDNGISIGSNVIQVTYFNTPPSINIAGGKSINEGETDVANVEASDADGDSLTYSISSQDPGIDAEYLSISSTGLISFNSAPDWENPTDYDSDNNYEIRVTVSDGSDSVYQDLSIYVQNIND